MTTGWNSSYLTDKGNFCMAPNNEVRIDVWTAGVDLPLSVRATHIPTGITGEATGFWMMRTRAEALAKVWDELHEDAR